MLRPRAAVASLVTFVLLAAAVVGDSYLAQRIALSGTSRFDNIWLTLFAQVGLTSWPFREGNVGVAFYFAFAAGILVAAAVGALVCLASARSASPLRGGAAVFFGTWFGCVLGALLATTASRLILQSTVYPSGLTEQQVPTYYLNGVTGGAYWGVLYGWFIALCAVLAFIASNARTRAAAREQEATLDGDGWPQYAVPAGRAGQPGQPGQPGPYAGSTDFQEENFGPDGRSHSDTPYAAGPDDRTRAYRPEDDGLRFGSRSPEADAAYDRPMDRPVDRPSYSDESEQTRQVRPPQ